MRRHEAAILALGLAAAGVLVWACLTAVGGDMYGRVRFFEGAELGAHSAVQGVQISTASGGNYTNAQAYTNHYQVWATNARGYFPVAVTSITFTGNASSTNAVRVTWDRKGGAAGYIVAVSWDLGTTYTNYEACSAATTNWVDLYTNTWTLDWVTNDFSAHGGCTSRCAFALTNDLAAYTNWANSGLVGTNAFETHTNWVAAAKVGTNAFETHTNWVAAGLVGTNAFQSYTNNGYLLESDFESYTNAGLAGIFTNTFGSKTNVQYFNDHGRLTNHVTL